MEKKKPEVKNKKPSKKINVGSGQDIRPKEQGWVNLDMHKRLGADCIFNLDDLYKGKKMPFKDNTFSYTLCSHVIEDFIDPIPIMDELVRITKPGGKIDFRVPYETTTWDGIYHKKPFNVITFLSYMNRQDYEKPEMGLKIDRIRFYHSKVKFTGWLINPLFVTKRFLMVHLFNFLIKFKKHAVDYSFIKYMAHNIFLKVIYTKTK